MKIRDNLHLKSLVAHAPCGICILESDRFQIELFNEKFLSDTEKTKKDILSKSFPEIFQASADKTEEILRTVIGTGQSCNYHDNGFSCTYTPIADDTGKVIAVATWVSDTDRPGGGKATVQQERDWLKNLVMQAPAGICILGGPKLIYELVNPAYQGILPGRELTRRSIFDALPELAGGAVEKMLLEVYRSGEPRQIDEMLIPIAEYEGGPVKDRYFSFSFQARRNENEVIDGIINIAFEVTGIIGMQQELREAREESERQRRVYETIISGTPDLMYVFGTDYRFKYANKALLEMWGKTWDNAIGKNLLENGYEPWHAEMHEREIDHIIATKQSVRGEVAFPHAVFGKRIYDYIFIPVLNQQGEVEAIAGTTRDVTDRKQSEEKLAQASEEMQALNEEMMAVNEEQAASNEELAATNEELETLNEEQLQTQRLLEASEQRLRSLVAAAPFPIGVYIGREMRILLANQAILDVWGKGSDVIGKTYRELLPELAGQQIFEQLDRVYMTGKPFHARNQRVDLVIGQDLKTFYFNYSFTPLQNDDGSVYGVMNTGAEVTDLVLAKQQVEQSEENLKAMIAQAPVAMCILSGAEHVITVANHLMVELWGKPKAEVMNKPVFEALPDARGQGLEEVMKKVYDTGESYYASELPVSLVRHGRTEVVYQNFVYQAYRDASGAIKGVLAITMDVTAQVVARQTIEKSEAELRETKRQLEAELEISKQVQRQKDDFIGMASHELKTPLTSLQALLQVARLKLKDTDDKFLAGAIEKSNIQAKRMTAMINGFLNVSRLEAGKIQIEKQKFDLNALIKDVLDETRLTVYDHEFFFPNTGVMYVNADRDKINSVISNLVSNAVKYSPKGKTINLKCKRDDVEIIVSVDDEGMGIKPQDIENIFDRYYRVKNQHTQQIAGFGIGLYLSAEIIRLHGGRIWAESEAGKGSTFYFSLPV